MANLAEQETPQDAQEEREIVWSLEKRSVFADRAQSCVVFMQEEDTKGLSLIRVLIGQWYLR